MITFGSLLVFVFAASLPIAFLLIVRRWIEPEYRRASQGHEQERGEIRQDIPAKPSDWPAAPPAIRSQDAGPHPPEAAEHQSILYRFEACYDPN